MAEQATRLDTYRGMLTTKVDAIDWAGHGQAAAAQAAKDLSAQIAKTSKDANDWATELDKIAAEIEKQLEMKKLAMALFFGFFIIGIIAAVALLPLVTMLATFLAGILASVVSATLAAQIALFAAGFVIFGALALALDFGAGALDAHLRGEKFTPTWENALMIIVGALTGGLFLLKPTTLVERVVANLGTRGIGGPKITGTGSRPTGSSSPDIQIINHVNGNATKVGLGPRPLPPPKLSVGGVQKVAPPPVNQVGQVAKPPLVGTTNGGNGVRQVPRGGSSISANPRANPPVGDSVATVKPTAAPPAADVAGVTGGPVRTPPPEAAPPTRLAANRPPSGDVVDTFGPRAVTPRPA